MKTYFEYKDRIAGLYDVAETVKTVEKIAASSIHTLKQEVRCFSAYTEEIEAVMRRLLRFSGRPDHPLLSSRGTGGRAALVITGDRGLVGGLWHAVVGECLARRDRYDIVLVVGAKGARYLEEERCTVEQSFRDVIEDAVSGTPSRSEQTDAVGSYLFDAFGKGLFSRVDVVFPHFVSLGRQRPVTRRLLPFGFSEAFDDPAKAAASGKEAEGWPIFESPKGVVFDRLMRKYVGTYLYGILLEAKLSELAARTVAMEHASAKTDQLRDRLAFGFAKERRRMLTQRQVESFSALRRQSLPTGAHA